MQAPGASVGRMYGADLLGAAAAAGLLLPTLHVLPTPTAAAALGVLPIAAALVLGGSRWVGALSLAVIGAVAAWGAPLEVRHTKAYVESGKLRPEYELWTPTARLTFFERAFFGNRDIGFGWGFGDNAPKAAIEQYWMEQDASAGTPITRFDGDVNDMAELSYLFYDVTTVGYQMRSCRRVAVIGGGGGRDILSALLARAEHIDAVELNAGVVQTMSTRYRDFAGDVYHAPGVHAHVSEGRAFLTRAAGGYDCIQISLIDSWAATAAGAYALAENNLYTVEAYRLYLSKLSPDGFVSTSRWMHGTNTLELYRLLFLQQQALRESGIAAPDAHTAVVGGNAVGTVLTSKRALSPDDVARLQATCTERGFRLLYPLAHAAPNPLDVPNLLEHGPGVFEIYGLTMKPPTDDCPFFFQALPIFGSLNLAVAQAAGINSMAVRTLQYLMIVLLAITLVLFFLPLALARVRPPGTGFWRGSVYFAAIGLAFMLIEVPWLQRCVLFVGHPSIAATVVIGALLLGAGCGALQSARTGLRRWRTTWVLAPVLLATGNALMPTLFASTLGWPEAARIALAVALLLPVGFLLGHFFPLGMVRFGDTNKAWYWALNGACGVLASVCSLALAMEIGFTAVAWIGVACYALAGLLLSGRGGHSP
jgi:hypothetical protein